MWWLAPGAKMQGSKMVMPQDAMPSDCWAFRQCGSPALPCELVLFTLLKWEGLFEVRSRVLNKTIPSLGYLVLPSVPVEGWIIEPCVHSLLDGPSEGIWLPSNSGLIVQFIMMTWGVGMVIIGKVPWYVPSTFPQRFLQIPILYFSLYSNLYITPLFCVFSLSLA